MTTDIIGRLRQENRKAIGKALDAVVRYSKEHEEIIKVVVFGSAARDTIDALSDLDLMIVMDTGGDFFSRSKGIVSIINEPVDVDILCYRPDELERMADRPFIKHIIQEGKVIYEK